MEPVMRVELTRENHETGCRAEAQITLPAPRCMLEDAEQRIGVMDDRTPFDVTVVRCLAGELDDAKFPHTTLNGLNFLAGRLGNMDSDRFLVYRALLHQNLTLPDMKRLINLTYGLDAVPSFVCSGDRDFGLFCIDNDMLGPLGGEFEHLPDSAYPMLDAAKIGKAVREAQNGVLAGGRYIDLSQYGYREICDGVNLPAKEEEPYVFRLLVSGCGSFRSREAGSRRVWITLPADTDALEDIARQLGEKHIQDCRCYAFLSSVPQITELNFGGPEHLAALNDLAHKISAMPQDALVKFKAVLEYENCETAALALELSDRLDRYEFQSDIRGASDYGSRFLSEHLTPGLDPALLSYLNLTDFGGEIMRRSGAAVTGYGCVEKMCSPALDNTPETVEKEDGPSMTDADEESGMGGFHL